MLFDAGLAGICMPREYGGQGLTPAHQQALNDELAGYEYPMRLQAPTFTPCAAVLLDFGTEEQKQRHLPAILKGEEIWMQFLSEPSGGSDVAGALTTAVRDGDEWVLNGSKVWTTGAWWSDWGLCLARTNWDVPKHRGLTVFMLPIDSDGVEMHRIEMLNGNKEFCQEFLSDVRVPDRDRVGEVDDGWTVGTRWMFHERMLYNSPFVTRPVGTAPAGATAPPRCSPSPGTPAGSTTPRAVTSSARRACSRSSVTRSGAGSATASPDGTMSDQASAIARLFGGHAATRRTTIAFELAGAAGAAWSDDDGQAAGCGTDFLMRQVELHRRRHHRDGAQRHQRAGAGHAPRAHPRPRRRLPGRPPQRLPRLIPKPGRGLKLPGSGPAPPRAEPVRAQLDGRSARVDSSASPSAFTKSFETWSMPSSRVQSTAPWTSHISAKR